MRELELKKTKLWETGLALKHTATTLYLQVLLRLVSRRTPLPLYSGSVSFLFHPSLDYGAKE